MIAKIEKEIVIFLILFFGASLASYWLLNGGALAKELRYDIFLNLPFTPLDIKNEGIFEVERNRKQVSGESAIYGGAYRLDIPKIGVSAPIIMPRDNSMGAILAGLEEGVGLYPDSSLPGGEGRSVILGHSSRASWYRGDFATVFALLHKLEIGDEFSISSGKGNYRYRIFDKKTLSPEETNMLLSNSVRGSEVVLITCYPIGSSSQRTVIQAKLFND